MIDQNQLYVIRNGTLDEVNEVLNTIEVGMIERVLLVIPQTVMNLLRYGKKLSESAEDFYAANPELANNKDLVAKVAQIVESENPGAEITKILEETKNRLEGSKGMTIETDRPSAEQLANFARAAKGQL